MTEQDDPFLETCLDAARARRPEVPDAFLERQATLAETLMPPPSARDVQRARRAGFWTWMPRVILPGGLTAALVLGLWVGASPPMILQSSADTLLTSDAALELVYNFPALSAMLGDL